MKRKSIRFSISTRNAIAGYLFIIPWIFGFAVFTAYPFFYSIYISLSSLTITPQGIETVWVGIANYRSILTEDVHFPVALADSLIFVALSTPLIVVASLLIAILLNGKFRGRLLYRAVYFLPVIIMSGPVMSELIENRIMILEEPSKYAFYAFFMTLPRVVNFPVLYVFDNLISILWFSGVQILIFLAGLQKIDASLYEAARIDGASPWDIFLKIILPFIKPIAMINAIYSVVEMSSFPNNSINAEIARRMFEIGRVYSYSAAMAWIYFILILVILCITFLLLRERREAR